MSEIDKDQKIKSGDSCSIGSRCEYNEDPYACEEFDYDADTTSVELDDKKDNSENQRFVRKEK